MPDEDITPEIEPEAAEAVAMPAEFNLFGETHSDDLNVLDYLLRNVKGISPTSGEPVDGVPGVDDIVKALNS